MPDRWEKTGQSRAPLSGAIEYFMDPENSLKAHPNFVKGVKVLSNEGDTVTWEQRAAFMGMHLRSMAKASLNRATNTIETRVIEGNGKGTITTRTLMEIPTGTEVHYTYELHPDSPLLALLVFLGKGRAKKTFEETLDEDIKALDALP